MEKRLHIAIVGAGPSGLFLFKKLLETGDQTLNIDIYEKHSTPGAGMPYSEQGALPEHITNVSANEIPQLVTPLEEWIKTVDAGLLKQYGINADHFHEFKVLPRLLFGKYLTHQFRLLERSAKKLGIAVEIFYNHEVVDIHDEREPKKVEVQTKSFTRQYDIVSICTGHYWPLKNEQNAPGYFDSPYPPSKLIFRVNGSVAIKGASLTAIDAVRTLARQHGHFTIEENRLSFIPDDDVPDFKIVMHSLNGLLPAVRFHLEDSSLGKDTVLSAKEIQAHREQNNGFVSLDYIFERNFKQPLSEKDPAFYEKIKDFSIEDFVGLFMGMRERMDPFDLLKKEYGAAEKSIREQQPIHWKEMLAVLSFAMNYPAKYFSAEDMLRLQQTLMPLISIVIAFIPQTSANELIAMYEAGVLKVVSVTKDSRVEVKEKGGVNYMYRNEAGGEHFHSYPVYIDCTGQPALSYQEFPYESLRRNMIVSPARIKFRDKNTGQQLFDKGDERVSRDELGNFYLRVPGVAINDYFQIVDAYNALNDRIYIMAVPLIGGYNPDYSGLDFCEAASSAIVKRIFTPRREAYESLSS